jgi:hypothetical protein
MIATKRSVLLQPFKKFLIDARAYKCEDILDEISIIYMHIKLDASHIGMPSFPSQDFCPVTPKIFTLPLVLYYLFALEDIADSSNSGGREVLHSY